MSDKIYNAQGLNEVQMYIVMLWRYINIMVYMGLHKQNPMWFASLNIHLNTYLNNPYREY